MASADVEAALSSIVDECFDLRARILDVERAAAPSPAPLSATLPPRSAAAAAAAAAAAEPALGRAKDALFEPPADQNLEAGSSISGSTRASPEPGAVPPDPFLVRSPSVASSAASQMSRPTLQRQPAVDAKDVTRFLATNGLEIASTVAGIAGAAAHFAPVPGLGAAVATIDDTVRYLQLDVDAPFAVKEYCADLADIKAVLAPMSNQWFSPDVQRRCEVLLTLLRDAQQLLEHARSETHSWTIPLGAAASKFDAQIEGFRRQLGRARELLFLSMQVDSAAMLMRMAKQLNIIDVKPERLLSILRPRSLLLRHSDLMIAPKRLDSSGAFIVHEAKMDGSAYVLKEFRESIAGSERAIEAEARKWFDANHSSVLQLTGICLSRDDETGIGPFLAMPFVDHDLESFVKQHPDLDTRDRLGILLRIARGIKYLHDLAPSAPIVHGRLSFRHIRIESSTEIANGKRAVKIRKAMIVPSVGVTSQAAETDAEALLVAPEARLRSTFGFKEGAMLYDYDWSTDPDNPITNKPKPPRDIYAFSVIAGCLLSRMTISELLLSNQSCPPDIDAQLWEILSNCSLTDPQYRPSIDTLLLHLNKAYKAVNDVPRIHATATDVETLCTIFPGWAQDNDIHTSSVDPQGDLVYLFDSQTHRSTQAWRLEWDGRHSLTSLRLTACDIAGQISGEIGNLVHLRELWLDNNAFEGDIPRSIGKMRHLNSLRLGSNKLTGKVPVTLCQLTNLHELDLSNNPVTVLPTTLDDLVNLRILNLSKCALKQVPEAVFSLVNLEILDLCGRVDAVNAAQGTLAAVPPSIGKLVKLQRLNIANSVVAELPAEVGRLRHLTLLDVSNNRIVRLPAELGGLHLLATLKIASNPILDLPDSIGDLESLEHLDASFTKLEHLPDSIGELAHLAELLLGNTPIKALPDLIGRLSRLVSLDLEGCDLAALPDTIGQLQSLRDLRIPFNHIEHLPDSIGNLTMLTSFNAESTRLVALPDSFGRLSRLVACNLGYNEIEELPDSFGNFPRLVTLTLSFNSLKRLPAAIGGMRNLVMLYADGNRIESLPDSISQLESLELLSLSKNRLTMLPPSMSHLQSLNFLMLEENPIEAIPEWFGNLRQLSTLWLANTNIAVLPESFSRLTHLDDLAMNNCKLRALPDSFGQLESLRILKLENNHIASLPDSIAALTQLTRLSISGNPITTLPDWISNFWTLLMLFASSCKLKSVPESIGVLTRLSVIDLSDNDIEVLPESIGALTNLRMLHLKGNKLKALPDCIGNMALLINLDIGDNAISQLPDSIGRLRELSRLVAPRNQLRTLPETLRQLREMQAIDLGENQLESIPDIFAGLPKLSVLDLSKNQLTALPPLDGHLPSIGLIDLSFNKFPARPISARLLGQCSVNMEGNPFNWPGGVSESAVQGAA